MRHLSRRSFTVEVKSVGRRNATFIPSRVAEPAAPKPRPDPAPTAPAPEKRRILPNLIEPDIPAVEPGPDPVAEAPAPRRPRGRPRKPRPDPAEPVAIIPVRAPEPEPELSPPPATPEAVRPGPAPRRAVPQGLDLARGERWKRRLGRWSR